MDTNDNGADGKVACRSRLGGLLNYYGWRVGEPMEIDWVRVWQSG